MENPIVDGTGPVPQPDLPDRARLTSLWETLTGAGVAYDGRWSVGWTNYASGRRRSHFVHPESSTRFRDVQHVLHSLRQRAGVQQPAFPPPQQQQQQQHQQPPQHPQQ